MKIKSILRLIIQKQVSRFVLFSLIIAPQYSFSQTHVTLNLKNCTVSSDSTLEFDITLVNDGSTRLKLGAVSLGITYDSAILNGGAPSNAAFFYQQDSKDKALAKLNHYTLQQVLARHHLRLAMSPLALASAPVLASKVEYKIGRFTLTNTTKWAAKKNPTFKMILNKVGGYTNCAVNVFVDDANTSTTLDKNDTRSGIVDCQIDFK